MKFPVKFLDLTKFSKEDQNFCERFGKILQKRNIFVCGYII